MRIENLVKRVTAQSDGWVRVSQVCRIRTGLELCIAVYDGRRGKKAEGWRIRCLGVRDFQIADMDGGGLALYGSTHPAALHFLARQAHLRWHGSGAAEVTGALCQAHIDAVDDWIPIDQYLDIRAIARKKKFTCRGPDFLMRAYAKALRDVGALPQIKLRRKGKSAKAPVRGLHFGGSFIVASAFVIQSEG